MDFYSFSERLDNTHFDSPHPHLELSIEKIEWELVGHQDLLLVAVN